MLEWSQAEGRSFVSAVHANNEPVHQGLEHVASPTKRIKHQPIFKL